MQLSKKLETLLMDNEDLRDQNDRLNTRLVTIECEKMNEERQRINKEDEWIGMNADKQKILHVFKDFEPNCDELSVNRFQSDTDVYIITAN